MILDAFAHVEVPPLDVFNFLMMFRIVGGVPSSRVVATQCDRLAAVEAQPGALQSAWSPPWDGCIEA